MGLLYLNSVQIYSWCCKLSVLGQKWDIYIQSQQIMSYPGYNQANLNCPNKPKKRDEEEMYEGEDYSAEYSDQDPNEAYNTFNPQQEALLAAQREEELKHKAMEVDNQTWDTAEFYFDELIDLNNDYIVDNGKGGIKLKDKGVITLSVANGGLQLGTRTKEGDFKMSAVTLKPVDGKMKKKLNLPLNSDIVKSAYLEGFNIEGWSERVLMRLSTIPKFQEEGFFGNSETVTKMIMPHEWKSQSHRIKIFDRTINNGMFSFQSKYPGASPQNLHKGIQKPVNGFCLVDFNSPVVGTINIDKKAHVEGGVYLAPSLVETNQVAIPKELVKIYTAKALKSMSYGISYGNVTDDRFTIEFETTVPTHMASAHTEFLKTGQTGRQFLGFADPYKSNTMSLGAVINENIKSRTAIFKEPNSHALRIQGKLVVQYKRSAYEQNDNNEV